MKRLSFPVPKRIRLLQILFCIAPFWNLFYHAQELSGANQTWKNLGNYWNPFLTVLIGYPFIIAISLPWKTRWVYFNILLYLTILFFYNCNIFQKSPNTKNVSILAQNLLIISLFVLIFKRDFRSPYLSKLTRGWRRSQRLKKQRTLSCNIGQFYCLNYSKTGFLLKAKDFPKGLEPIRFQYNSKKGRAIFQASLVHSRQELHGFRILAFEQGEKIWNS